MLTSEEWFALGSGGGPNIVEVCTLPHSLVGVLGAQTNKIHCRQDYIQKIRFKHHIPAHNLWIVQPTIDFGLVVQCEARKLTFIGFHELHQKYYEAAIKVTQARHEIWLETFHRTKPTEIRRKMKKYPIITRE